MLITQLDIVLRLSLAVLIGSVIGLDRNSHGKPAGLRTHALVALGAALIVIVSGQLTGAEAAHVADAQSRTIQGLITGIGFLGGGVILHSMNDKRVHGLTTAATVWVAALFGVACGIGVFRAIWVAFALLAIIMAFGGRFECAIYRRLHPDTEDEPQ